MSLVLGLDCSGETYSAGLWGEAGQRLEVSGYQPRRALCELPAAIAYLLETAGARATDLSAVGVTSGPGSFTGVRLGVTVAKTAAMVANCPVTGWDTLELLARQHLPEGSLGIVAVALDARRGELYCAIFQRTEAALEASLATDVRKPEEFARELLALGSPDAAVGSGFEAYPLLGPDWRGARLVTRQDSAPSGLTVARLTAASPSRHTSAADLVPVYHRRADIQVQPSGGR